MDCALPRIYVDFNEMVTDNVVLLSKDDAKCDSAGNIVNFYEGMPVALYMDDLDADGNPDDLMAAGVAVRYNLSAYPYWRHVRWCCLIDGDGIRHQSEIKARPDR